MNRHSSRNETRFYPPVRVTDDERNVYISIGLPGVTEEHIRIDLEKTILTVSITENGKTVRTMVRVPRGVRFFKKSFFNGILEIILEKAVP